MYAFRRHHPELSIRKPDAANFSRIRTYNCVEIDLFYNNLEYLYDHFALERYRLFDVDKIEVTNIYNPSNIVANIRAKTILANIERNQTTTIVCVRF